MKKNNQGDTGKTQSNYYQTYQTGKYSTNGKNKYEVSKTSEFNQGTYTKASKNTNSLNCNFQQNQYNQPKKNPPCNSQKRYIPTEPGKLIKV